MAIYSTGTVDVTNGSNIVAGTGTDWFATMADGWLFNGPDGRLYPVSSVNSDTQITLETVYAGANAANADYFVFSSQTFGQAIIDQVIALLNLYQQGADTIMQGKFPGMVASITDADTGLSWLAANVLGLTAGGSSIIEAHAAKAVVNGFLGLGVANPLTLLHMKGAEPGLMLEESDAPVNEQRWRIRPIDGDLRFEGVNDGYSASSPAIIFRRVDALHQTKAIEFYTQNIMRAILDENGFLGLGTTNPIRPFHVKTSSDGSARMRLENSEGWIDLLADGTRFRLTTNGAGQISDTNFLDYDGINGRLGINAVSTENLRVHEPSNSACTFRMGNNEGSVEFRVDGGDRLAIRPVSVGADRFDLYEYGRFDILGDASNNNHKLGVYSRNLSFSNNLARIVADRPGGSGFDYFSCFSNDAVSADRDFYVRGDGAAYTDVTFNSGGADYAEFFEWADGNMQGEDRRGVSVVLEGALIRPALAGEDPFGVISASPSVVGDSDMDRWKEKYLRDEFGSVLYEDYQVVAWDSLRPVQDPETGAFGGEFVQHQYATDALPEGVTPPEDATWTTQQRRVLNPLWRSDEAYIPRSERLEWDYVGTMGKLRLRKGQPVGARWLKMRDVTDTVEEWLVR